jgi:hypothetical protein
MTEYQINRGKREKEWRMVSTINDIDIKKFFREVLTYVHLVCCNGNSGK